MKTLSQDAMRMSLLFQFGAVRGDEIIKWADEKVIDLDPLPDALLELVQTTPENTADIISCLHQLSLGAGYWEALRQSLGWLHDFICSNPAQAERIASTLYYAVTCEGSGEIPSDLLFVLSYDDAFSLARDGVYGSRETVLAEFIAELGKYRLASSSPPL